jgi:nitrate reductase (cytochrome)
MGITRRDFLKYTAATSAVMALGGRISLAAAEGGAGAVDKWVKGVCRFCGTGCGVMVGVKDGRVVTVKGDPNNHNPHAPHHLCQRARHPALDPQERPTHPGFLG